MVRSTPYAAALPCIAMPDRRVVPSRVPSLHSPGFPRLTPCAIRAAGLWDDTDFGLSEDSCSYCLTRSSGRTWISSSLSSDDVSSSECGSLPVVTTVGDAAASDDKSLEAWTPTAEEIMEFFEAPSQTESSFKAKVSATVDAAEASRRRQADNLATEYLSKLGTGRLHDKQAW